MRLRKDSSFVKYTERHRKYVTTPALVPRGPTCSFEGCKAKER